jgi:molybdopterin molybdotransferase
MLRVDEARSVILEAARPLPPETLPLASALGLVLAEDVASDLDMPPFDKSLMDGYAVVAADLAAGSAELAVIDEVMAGQTPRRPVEPGRATRIMTGAPIPPGADAVVPVERTTSLPGDRVRIESTAKPGQFVLPRGQEMRTGETVLAAGHVLRPQELGLLATVGRTSARLVPSPRVAVLPTGDEIVDPSVRPGPGQIRNGNGPMLLAQVARAGGRPTFLGVARDEVGHLRALVAEGLTHDVLVLSGGVSAGQRDLVPGVLDESGVKAHFHKVEMKPGKPLLFGTRPRDAAPPTLVFGLPGNPVSSLVGFELFVRPALRVLRGLSEPGPTFVQAELAEDFAYRTDRPTYHPADLSAGARGWRVRLVPWFGSPDLRALTRANALALMPAGDHHHRAGQALPVLPMDEG